MPLVDTTLIVLLKGQELFQWAWDRVGDMTEFSRIFIAVTETGVSFVYIFVDFSKRFLDWPIINFSKN